MVVESLLPNCQVHKIPYNALYRNIACLFKYRQNSQSLSYHPPECQCEFGIILEGITEEFLFSGPQEYVLRGEEMNQVSENGKMPMSLPVFKFTDLFGICNEVYGFLWI